VSTHRAVLSSAHPFRLHFSPWTIWWARPIDIIAPVRNEIAHVREVSNEQLQRANLACSDINAMLGAAR